jgi:hypothetical protein
MAGTLLKPSLSSSAKMGAHRPNGHHEGSTEEI